MSSGIDDFRRKILALIPDGFAERILDCWVVAVDKVAVDKLNSKGGLAYNPQVSMLRVAGKDKGEGIDIAMGVEQDLGQGSAYATKPISNSNATAGRSEDLPTERLPTMAIFLFFGVGIYADL